MKLPEMSRASIIFYAILAVVVVLLMFPGLYMDLFESGFDSHVAPKIDQLSMSWLQNRGIEFSRQEREVPDA